MLRQRGIAPAQALAVGDEMRDWETALTGGIAFGVVSWGYARFDTLPVLPVGISPKQMTDIERLVLE